MADMNECKNCGELTTNKVYCSVKCQHEGYRGRKIASRVGCECLNCHKKFQIKKSDVKYGRGKYFSRKCNDEHKKITYLGENNPMFNREFTEEHRRKQSKSMIEFWSDPDNKEMMVSRINESLEQHYEEYGHGFGWSEESKLKRQETNIKRFGHPHNWEGTYGERQCDKTFEERYGMPSYMYYAKCGLEARGYDDTSIERIIKQILDSQNIEYEEQYRIATYYVDVFLPDYNLVIEADGDYWHANPDLYDEYDEIQKVNIERDKAKSKELIEFGYNLERFFGSEIRSENFQSLLLSVIRNYE